MKTKKAVNIVLSILALFFVFLLVSSFGSTPLPDITSPLIENYARTGFPFAYLDSHKGLCCSNATDYSLYVKPFLMNLVAFTGVILALFFSLKTKIKSYFSRLKLSVVVSFIIILCGLWNLAGIWLFDDQLYLYKDTPQVQELDCSVLNCVPELYLYR